MADVLWWRFILPVPLCLSILERFTRYSMRQAIPPVSLPHRSKNNEHITCWPQAIFLLICSFSQHTWVMPHYSPCIFFFISWVSSKIGKWEEGEIEKKMDFLVSEKLLRIRTKYVENKIPSNPTEKQEIS